MIETIYCVFTIAWFIGEMILIHKRVRGWLWETWAISLPLFGIICIAVGKLKGVL